MTTHPATPDQSNPVGKTPDMPDTAVAKDGTVHVVTCPAITGWPGCSCPKPAPAGAKSYIPLPAKKVLGYSTETCSEIHGYDSGDMQDHADACVVAALRARGAVPSDVVTEDATTCQRRAFTKGWDERGMAHEIKSGIETDDRMRALLDVFYPRAAAPQPPAALPGEQDAERALLKVLSIVQRYLPPDGPNAHDAMTAIIGVVDPWPLGKLEVSQ